MDFLKKFDFGRDGEAEPVKQEDHSQRAETSSGQKDVQLISGNDDTLMDYAVPQGLAAAYFNGDFKAEGQWATGFEDNGDVDIGFDQVLDPYKPATALPIITEDRFLRQSQQPDPQLVTSALSVSGLFGGAASVFTPQTQLPGFADGTELAHRSYARAEFNEEASSVSSSDSRSVAELPRSADGDDDSELLVQNFRNGYRGMSCD
ncbi:hypothetical protein NCC49_004393 [Naganishia albida]|nr:hypothetical protein NCC49_004393 [Naganishia albida]